MVSFMETIFEDLEVRPTTRHLIESIFLDLPLTNPVATDFGVESANHYRAMKEVLFGGLDELEDEDDEMERGFVMADLRQRILDLDEALGCGRKLNILVRTYAPAYADLVHFHTSWDDLYFRTDEEQEEE